MKGEAAGAGEAIYLFFCLTLGGIVLGLIFGSMSTMWIKRIFNDEVLVTNITVLTAYLVFFYFIIIILISFFFFRCFM